MKILKLEAENVKRLYAVEITPDGNLITIGGKNAQGKSSCLDAIMMALGGKKWGRVKPLRKGAESGKVVLHLSGDDKAGLFPMVVERTFHEDGSSHLEVRQEDDNGVYKAASPQALLDGVVGRLAFDPLEFLDPKQDQVAMLREAVGLDFTEHDRKYKSLYEERANVNRDGKAIKARLDGMPQHADAPADEVAVESLVAELERRETQNRENADKRRWCDTLKDSITLIDNEIAETEQKLVELKARKQHAVEKLELHVKALESFVDADTNEIRQQLATLDVNNRKCRENKAHQELAGQVDELRKQSAALSDRLKEIDKAKADAMAAAKWPVPGLGFDADGVTLNGLPFEQASSAEQLRVSVAMGAAMNPTLPFVLIREGSSLDDDNQALLRQMADELDCQVFLEIVSVDPDKCSVIIEDGRVKENRNGASDSQG